MEVYRTVMSRRGVYLPRSELLRVLEMREGRLWVGWELWIHECIAGLILELWIECIADFILVYMTDFSMSKITD